MDTTLDILYFTTFVYNNIQNATEKCQNKVPPVAVVPGGVHYFWQYRSPNDYGASIIWYPNIADIYNTPLRVHWTPRRRTGLSLVRPSVCTTRRGLVHSFSRNSFTPRRIISLLFSTGVKLTDCDVNSAPVDPSSSSSCRGIRCVHSRWYRYRPTADDAKFFPFFPFPSGHYYGRCWSFCSTYPREAKLTWRHFSREDIRVSYKPIVLVCA